MANTNITPLVGALALTGGSESGLTPRGSILAPLVGALALTGSIGLVSPGTFHAVDYLPVANGASAAVETQNQWAADLAPGGALANGFQAGILYPAQFNKLIRQGSMMASALANFIANTNNTNLFDDGNLPALISSLTAAVNSAASAPSLPVPATLTGLAVAETFVNGVARLKWNQMAYATGYTVVVKHTAGGSTLRTVTTTDVLFEYSWEDSTDDGGPFADLTFVVNAFNGSGTGGAATLVTTPNPAPGAPTIAHSGVVGGISISATPPTDTDIVGLKIWMSTSSGFTPGGGNLQYQGYDIAKGILGLVAGTTYFFRAAFYDRWGQEGTRTSELSEVPSAVSGTGGTVVVGTLGAVAAQGTLEFLTTDNKIYRSDGTNWLRSVDGADLLPTSVPASAMNVARLSDISAQLGAISSGQWTMSQSNPDFEAGGQSAYKTGRGFWKGFSNANWQWSLGDSAANKPMMSWDGAALTILGSQINVDSIGAVFGGQTGYNTGTGFWMGFSGSAFAVSIGNSAGAGMTWNGAALTLNQPLIVAGQGTYNGALSNATGTYAGTLVTSGVVTMANLALGAATNFQANENTAAVNLSAAFQNVIQVPGIVPLTTFGFIVMASVDLQNPGGGGGNHQVQLVRTVSAVNTTLWTGYAYQLGSGQSAAFSKTWYDAPPVGSSVTYSLQVKATNASDQAKNASLVAMELRR